MAVRGLPNGAEQCESSQPLAPGRTVVTDVVEDLGKSRANARFAFWIALRAEAVHREPIPLK
jgi:hypothetical protein